MKLSQFSTQTLVNTALYILYQDLKAKQNALLVQLNQHYDLPISQSHLSKAYTLYKKEGVLYQKKSALAKETMEKLLAALKSLLQKEHDILEVDAVDAVFANKSRRWPAIKGQLEHIELPDDTKELLHTHDKLELYRKTELFETAKNIDILASYFTALPVLLDQLKIAIEKNNCTVRILMLDPYQDVIRQRAKDLGNIAGENPVEVAAMQAEKLREFARAYPQQVQFYLYNVLPVFSIVRFDNKMFVGYQWYNRIAGEGAYQEYQLDVPTPSPFIKNVKEHWQKLWDHARSWKDLRLYSTKFTCYIEKDHEIKSMDLMVNPDNNDAVLLDPHSKLYYYGTLYNLGPNIAVMHMQAENPQWTITLYLNAALDKFNLQELMTGICTIHSPEDREILSRRIVLVKVNSLKKQPLSAEERNKILRSYLSTLKNIHAASWQGLKGWLEGRMN